MKTQLLTLALIFCFCFSSFAQEKSHTGKFSGIFQAPLFLSTDQTDLSKTQLNLVFQSIYAKQKSNIRNTRELKKLKMIQKWNDIQHHNFGETGNKTTAVNPTIGTNFKGNELKTWTPTDNSIAVSNDGIIVSCINYGVNYYKTDGTPLLVDFTWNDFVNNALLNQAKYDPRVLYDNLHDRFIIVLLHGFSSTTSKILVCFSKTNNPTDGWHIYQLNGNPYNDTTWSDYPTIGINNDELFINCNRFGDAPLYKWKETYIYQIGLAEGYAGNSINYGLWNQIFTPDNQDGITLYPASHGMGDTMQQKMYFVQLMPDAGNAVYLYTIDGKLGSPNLTLSNTSFAVPPFEVCANALQKDPTTGNLDSLSTGNAWTQNAFYTQNTVHYVQCVDNGTGWCGISYGRILLDSLKAEVTTYSIPGTDLSYPAIASIGFLNTDKGVAIAYVQSDSNITPQCGVISVDDAMTWSNLQTVKTGDTVVNILYPPSYPVMPERWGDYTGICRKYNSTIPEAWMAAAYGANTPPRNASYGTWIAQIISNEPLSTITNQKNDDKFVLYPNPVKEIINIEFENKIPGNVSVKIIDINGREVLSIFNDYLLQSINRISFNKIALPVGNYIVLGMRENQVLFREKMIVK